MYSAPSLATTEVTERVAEVALAMGWSRRTLASVIIEVNVAEAVWESEIEIERERERER